MGAHQHLYFIAFVLPEPVLSLVEELKLLVAAKFGSRVCLKAPAHITLIPPFHFPFHEQVVATLQAFRWKENISIKLNGYDSFGQKVLYIKIEPNKSLNMIYYALQSHFEAMIGLVNKNKRQLFFVPHVTIGNRDWTKSQFLAARDYFTQNYPFEETCRLRNISLLKLDNGNWKIIDIITIS